MSVSQMIRERDFGKLSLNKKPLVVLFDLTLYPCHAVIDCFFDMCVGVHVTACPLNTV